MLDLYKMYLAYLLLGSFCIGEDLYLNQTSIVSMLERKPKVNIVSFKPLGDNVALGLDFQLPFIKVPVLRKTDALGNEPALVNINIAAVAATGILTASSALISYLFKKFIVFHPTNKTEKTHRSDNDFESEMWTMLNNFKLIYKNSSGAKVDASLPGLFSTIDEVFHQNNIDLSSCLQKALCHRIHQATGRSYDDNSTGLDKIIDGLTTMKWFQRNFIRHTSLNDVIGSTNSEHCELKYSSCKWSAPVDNFDDLIQTYLKFT